MRRVLVCGGRDFQDREFLDRVLYDKLDLEDLIISGMARGADRMAYEFAIRVGHPVLEFPADWDKYGRAAGYIRNQQMLDEGKPDLVIAFPGGRGTAHMKRIARMAGVKVIEV